MGILLDALSDTIKILPLLVGVYIIFEWIEVRGNMYLKRCPLGPVLGAISGCIPQCGASVAASSLYATGSITLGTLLAVFISTSDEAIPLMMTYCEQWPFIILLLIIKVCYAIVIGEVVDKLFNIKGRLHNHVFSNYMNLDDSNEHCVLFKSIIRSLKVVIFLFLMTCLMNLVMMLVGEEVLENWLLKTANWQPFVSAGIGLIPNCISSVLVTKLYLEGMISFGTVIAGLCTGAGAGLLVLFKENRSLFENIMIVFILYSVGVLIGLLLNWLPVLN